MDIGLGWGGVYGVELGGGVPGCMSKKNGGRERRSFVSIQVYRGVLSRIDCVYVVKMLFDISTSFLLIPRSWTPLIPADTDAFLRRIAA